MLPWKYNILLYRLIKSSRNEHILASATSSLDWTWPSWTACPLLCNKYSRVKKIMPLNTEQLVKSTLALLNSEKQVTIQLQTSCCQECAEYRNISWKHCYPTSCTFSSCFESFQSLHHQKKQSVVLFYRTCLPTDQTPNSWNIHRISQTCYFLVVLKICLFLGNQALPPTLNFSEVKKLLEKGGGNRYTYRNQQESSRRNKKTIFTILSLVGYCDPTKDNLISLSKEVLISTIILERKPSCCKDTYSNKSLSYWISIVPDAIW